MVSKAERNVASICFNIKENHKSMLRDQREGNKILSHWHMRHLSIKPLVLFPCMLSTLEIPKIYRAPASLLDQRNIKELWELLNLKTLIWKHSGENLPNAKTYILFFSALPAKYCLHKYICLSYKSTNKKVIYFLCVYLIKARKCMFDRVEKPWRQFFYI